MDAKEINRQGVGVVLREMNLCTKEHTSLATWISTSTDTYRITLNVCVCDLRPSLAWMRYCPDASIDTSMSAEDRMC